MPDPIILRFVPSSRLLPAEFAFQIRVSDELTPDEPVGEVFLTHNDVVESNDHDLLHGVNWLQAFGRQHPLPLSRKLPSQELPLSPNLPFQVRLRVRKIPGLHSDIYAQGDHFHKYDYLAYEILQGSTSIESVANAVCSRIADDSTGILQLTTNWDAIALPTGTAVNLKLAGATPPKWRFDAKSGDLVGTFYVIGSDVDNSLGPRRIKLAISEDNARRGVAINITNSGTPVQGRLLTIAANWITGLWGLEDRIERVVLSASEFQLDVTRDSKDLHVRFHSDVITPDAESLIRFWEMLSCGNSDPADYVRQQIDELTTKLGDEERVILIPRGTEQSRAIFRNSYPNPLPDDGFVVPDIEEVLVPNVRIEFRGLDRHPQWTPRLLKLVGGNYEFTDRDIKDTSSTDLESPLSVIFDVKNTSIGVESSDQLFLTETSLAAANQNGVLWQYAYIDAPPSRPGWIGYPLPRTPPVSRDTDPLGVRLTSHVDVPLTLNSRPWSLSLSPLADLPASGNLRVRFVIDSGDVSGIELACESSRFEISLVSPGVFAYNETLVDATAVPSPTNLARTLGEARLTFRNTPRKSDADKLLPVPQSVESVLAEINDTAIAFTAQATVRTFLHPGRSILRPISPAGRNVLSISADPQRPTVSLPDTSRGLIGLDVLAGDEFEIRFPTSTRTDEDATDREILGEFSPHDRDLPILAGSAIHGRFPWMLQAWDANPLSEFQFTCQTLLHRNLILEMQEFFRRLHVQEGNADAIAENWTADDIDRLARDAFANAANWDEDDDPTDPTPVLNFLPNATIEEPPKVAFSEAGEWPIAMVTVANIGSVHDLQVQHDVHRSDWLAYEASTQTFDDDALFPEILLEDRPEPTEEESTDRTQHQFQPLIFSSHLASFERSSSFDNAGVTRQHGRIRYGQDSQSTLRLLPLYSSQDEQTDHGLFVLDFDGPLVSTARNNIALTCRGLVVELEADPKNGVWSLKRVDQNRAAQLGDLGEYRIHCDGCIPIEDPPSLSGQYHWPLLGYYPVVPFRLETIQITADDDSAHPIMLDRVSFTAVLPSPRAVAFPDPSEFSTAVCGAETQLRVLTCEVEYDGAVSASGRFFWELAPEIPSVTTPDSIVTSDGPQEMSGHANYDGTAWMLTGFTPEAEDNGGNDNEDKTEPVSGTVRVFGTLSPASGFGMIASTYRPAVPDQQRDAVIFATEDFSGEPSGYGIAVSTDPVDLPMFRLKTKELGEDLEAILECLPVDEPQDLATADEPMFSCSETLILDSEDWGLRVIQDMFFGFSPLNSTNKALLLWTDQGKVEYRKWSEVPPVTANYQLKIGEQQIDLTGVQQQFVVTPTSGNTSTAVIVISAFLESESNYPGDPLRLVIQSQEITPEKHVTAQITIGNPDVQGGPIIAGTVRLTVNSPIQLELPTNEIYDLFPAEILRSDDRTNADVIVGGLEDQAIDLLPMLPRVPRVDDEFEPAYFVWQYGLTRENRPALADKLPVSKESGCLTPIPLPVVRTSDVRAEAIDSDGIELPLAPVVKSEAEQASGSDAVNSERPTQDDSLSGTASAAAPMSRIVTATSVYDTLFIAKRGARTGYIVDLAAEPSPTSCVSLPADILDACYSGRRLVIATLRTIWVLANGALRPVLNANNSTGWRTFRSLQTDPLESTFIFIAGTRENPDEDPQLGIYAVGDTSLTLTLWGRLPSFPFDLLSVGRFPNSLSKIAFIANRFDSTTIHWCDLATSSRNILLEDPILQRELAHCASSTRMVDGSPECLLAITMFQASTLDHTLSLFETTSTRSLKRLDLQQLPDRRAADVSLLQRDDTIVAALAYAASQSTDVLFDFSSHHEKLNCRFSLRGAESVSLVVSPSRGLLSITANLDSDQGEEVIDYQIDHLLEKLTCRSVDARTPIDRCADTNLLRPPEDQSLSVPQIWHSQAAGTQILATIPDNWLSITDGGQGVSSIGPPIADAPAWLAGPVVKIDERLQIVRTDLAIHVKDIDTLPPFRTDTLFGLSRTGNAGVLYNQSAELSELAAMGRVTDFDQEAEIKESLDAVVNRRAWHGITLWRTLLDDIPYLRFFAPSTQLQANRANRSPIASGPANSQTDEFGPDPRILPIDQLLTGVPPDTSEDQVLRPYPLAPTLPSAVSEGRDVRRWHVQRTSGSLADRVDYPNIEVLLGEIAAFQNLPRRSAVPVMHSPAASDAPREFLPQNIELAHGSGKPGAVISHRVQTFRSGVVDKLPSGYLNASNLASMRDPLRLAGKSTPQLRIDPPTDRPIELPSLSGLGTPTTILTAHRRLHVSWTISPLPIAVDSNKLRLTVPVINGKARFITYDPDTQRFGFQGKNRRVLALITLVDGQLLECPEYLNDHGVVRRNPNGDGTLPISIRNSVANFPRPFEPQLFLVTRVPGLQESTYVIGFDDLEFKPVVIVNDQLLIDFGDVFELVAKTGDFYLWKARSFGAIDDKLPGVWTAGVELSIAWQHKGPSEEDPEVNVYPWSIHPNDVKEEPKPLQLRVVQTGETHSHIVVSNDEVNDVVLAFEQATGDDVSRSQEPRLIIPDFPGETKLEIRDIYQASTDIELTGPLSDHDIRIVASLPAGEVIGGIAVRRPQVNSSSQGLECTTTVKENR